MSRERPRCRVPGLVPAEWVTRKSAASIRAEIEGIDGLHVHDRTDFTGPGLAADLDPLPVVIDLPGLGITGYRAAGWLRRHHHLDMHLADHRRISSRLTHADDRETAKALLTALRDLAARAAALGPAPAVTVPGPAHLRLDQVCPPREAFFGPGRGRSGPADGTGTRGGRPGKGPGADQPLTARARNPMAVAVAGRPSAVSAPDRCPALGG
ncbi:hypothetical protein ACIHFE_20765 [Streptomyces sp. NPDC052396]|uniref:hypothetical protein n=1 Tax=Streptomyces sp. NPDC052396 TaxID=3365689 RepID=UPI0037D77CCB